MTSPTALRSNQAASGDAAVSPEARQGGPLRLPRAGSREGGPTPEVRTRWRTTGARGRSDRPRKFARLVAFLRFPTGERRREVDRGRGGTRAQTLECGSARPRRRSQPRSSLRPNEGHPRGSALLLRATETFLFCISTYGTLQVKVYFIKIHSGNPCCWGQTGQVGKEKLSEY